MPDPIQEASRAKMNALAQVLDSFINGPREPGQAAANGFCLLIFPFDGVAEGKVNFISNANRADMREALAQLLARWDDTVLTPQGER